MHKQFDVELRAQLDGNTLTGIAAVFNKVAKIGMTYERLATTAFDKVLSSKDIDVRAFINHDPNMLLGRQSSGTLEIGVVNKGLQFKVDLPNTTYSNDVRELVTRGDLTGASFGFLPGEVSYQRARDSAQVVTHESIDSLLDVSVVTFPAYESTSVQLRSLQLDILIEDSSLLKNQIRKLNLDRWENENH